VVTIKFIEFYKRDVTILVKLCVFDLDGTLVNSLADLADCTNFALEKNGFKAHALPEYRHFVGDGVPMLIKRALGGNYSPQAEKTVLADFDKRYQKHFDDLTRPYNGNEDLLTALEARGIKYAVLSNKPDNFVKIIVAKMYPDFDFAWVQGKADGFPKKPDPTTLILILNTLGIKPSETLYIGDSNVDIFTGKNAGIETCGVTWGFRDMAELEEAGADHIVDMPEQILKLV
jgi:phosphoglycolate phosphatase